MVSGVKGVNKIFVNNAKECTGRTACSITSTSTSVRVVGKVTDWPYVVGCQAMKCMQTLYTYNYVYTHIHMKRRRTKRNMAERIDSRMYVVFFSNLYCTTINIHTIL